MTARAPELGVRVLDGRLDGGRPQRPDLDLSALEVDQADDHRLQLRIRFAGRDADELRVVGDRSSRNRRTAKRDGERDRERNYESTGGYDRPTSASTFARAGRG